MPAKRSAFTLAERVALGELVALAVMCSDAMDNSRASGNEAAENCNKALGAIVTERAACILRGEAEPREMSAKDILEFIDVWKADVPAQFVKDALKRRRPRAKRPTPDASRRLHGKRHP